MAVPNKKSKTPLPRATRLGQIPRIIRMPRMVSAAVAPTPERDGERRHEAIYLSHERVKLAKFPQLACLPHKSKRPATEEGKAEPSAIRVYRIARRSKDAACAPFASFVCETSEAVESAWNDLEHRISWFGATPYDIPRIPLCQSEMTDRKSN